MENSATFQLRSFIQQRLSAAVEEILAEVEKTVELALCGAHVRRPKEEVELRMLDSVPQISAAESLLIDCGVTGEEVPQEAATQEETFLSTAEIPGSSRTTADAKLKDGKCCVVLVDFKTHGKQEVIFPFPEVVQSEQDQPETRVSFELPPVSPDCSAAQSESSNSDEEQVQSKAATTKTKRRKLLQRQKGSMKQRDAESCDSTAKSKERNCVCPVCGRVFKYNRSFMKHIKIHEETTGDECDAPLLPENPGPSTDAKSDFSLSTEVPGPSQPSNDIDNDGWNHCSVETDLNISEIKEEQEELGVDSQTREFALQCDKFSAENEKGRSFCHLCGKGFQDVGSLLKHIKTHKKKIQCTICGMTQRSTKELITHLKGCHNETNCCDICGKTLSDSYRLWQHKQVHAGRRDFKCNQCGRAFFRREHLILHVRTHSGEKPYSCDICGKTFSQRGNVTVHKRSHSEERPHHCSVCGKRFKTKDHLKVHMRYHIQQMVSPNIFY